VRQLVNKKNFGNIKLQHGMCVKIIAHLVGNKLVLYKMAAQRIYNNIRTVQHILTGGTQLE